MPGTSPVASSHIPLYTSYYYHNDEPSPCYLTRPRDFRLSSSSTERTSWHSPNTEQVHERSQPDISRFPSSSEERLTRYINSDVLDDSEDVTRSPSSSGLIRPRSPPCPGREYESPVAGPSTRRPCSYNEDEDEDGWSGAPPEDSTPLSPLWHGVGPDIAIPDSPVFTPVSPEWTFRSLRPQQDRREEDECSLPSPTPSSPAETSEPPSSRPPSPQPSPPRYEPDARVSPSPSSPATRPITESHPIASEEPAASSKRRRATGRVRAPQSSDIIPRALLDKLAVSLVYGDKKIASVTKRKRGLYWTVKFTDNSSCCVCNVPGPYCARICADSRGINRHFAAAPHFLGRELPCSHPTHPCAKVFLRQDVLRRHLIRVAHPKEGREASATSGKQARVKKNRVAREGAVPY